jgi:hypothetical protein
MDKFKMATQLKLIQSPTQERIEKEINVALRDIAILGNECIRTKVWNYFSKSGVGMWAASIEYEVSLDSITTDEDVDREQTISALKRYRVSLNHTLSEIGLVGVRAIVVQNDLFKLTLNETYSELIDNIVSLTNLSKDSTISELEVKTIDVKISI